MASSFRTLRAYQLAAQLSAAVAGLVASWPSFERWSLGLQLVRAADSVGANIAEAAGRWHGPDKRRLYLIARGSLYETEHWLLTARQRGLLQSTYEQQTEEIGKTLNGLISRTGP